MAALDLSGGGGALVRKRPPERCKLRPVGVPIPEENAQLPCREDHAGSGGSGPPLKPALRAATDERFQELAQQLTTLTKQITELTESQKRTEVRLAELAQAQARTDVQIAALTQSIRTLTDDMGEVKGFSLEANYRAKVYAYFGRLLRPVHALSQDELASLLEAAIEKGALSASQAHEIALADIVVRGKRPEDGAEVYLVVKVSWGVGPPDVERASRRAGLLSQVGIPALPVVTGTRLTAEAVELARTQQVQQVIDGHAIPSEPTSVPSS